MPSPSSDPIQTRELSANKLIVGVGQTPITTQTTISDPAVTATGVTITATEETGGGIWGCNTEAEMDAIETSIDALVVDVAANNAAIDLIIVRLKAFGLIA